MIKKIILFSLCFCLLSFIKDNKANKSKISNNKCNNLFASKKYEEAKLYCEKEASKGDANAEYNLGFMYHTGEGVEQDFKEAASWYEKAANQGHAKAQNNLGFLYLYNNKIEEDYDKAIV